MGTKFPLMFPDRDDVIMPQWAIKVGFLPSCNHMGVLLAERLTIPAQHLHASVILLHGVTPRAYGSQSILQSVPLQVLHEETKGDAIVTTGVGQHQMWAAQYYKFDRPRQWATSGGLGSMGFGLPSALGAAVAFDGTDGGRPKKVCAMQSLRYTCHELLVRLLMVAIDDVLPYVLEL
jgi:hypothetical protein